MNRFVLKYATRDEIELLDSGSGGLPELRKVVENYDETSPLFGFLRYRRRVVIIRYLPEGCSRLIQGSFRNPSPHCDTKLIKSCFSTRDCPLQCRLRTILPIRYDF